MRIAVLGAGAMGSWFGGLLALQNNDVQLLTTNAAHYKAITKNGLVLKRPLNGLSSGQSNNRIAAQPGKLSFGSSGEQCVEVVAGLPTNIQAPVDLVLLTTKTFQTADAIASIEMAIDDHTHVLSLQNGLGNAEAIGEFVPPERIWVGVSMMPIDKVAPGVVSGKGHGSSYFGSASSDGDAVMAQRIESVFQSAHIDLHHDTHIHKRIWEKVAFNAGMNALSALSHGTPKIINISPGAKELAHDVANEVAVIANVRNVEIDLNKVYDMIKLSCTQHGDHVPSMLQDLRLGRQTEVDALNGAVARIAEQASIAAPLNTTLATLIRLAEHSHKNNS